MTGSEQPAFSEVKFHHSSSLPDVLIGAGCSLLLSTYQAGQLAAVGVHEGTIRFSFHQVDRAMGVAVGRDRIAVGARSQVWHLQDHSEVAPRIEPRGMYDRCFLPRTSTVTGNIQGHELAWGTTRAGDQELWIANTLFSCLATVHPDFSFVPRWRPPFISELAAEDRCHLNGVAMRDGTPAYVSVLAETDDPTGWRSLPKNSGAVLDVLSGAVVTTGLTMPHSPRWYGDQLFVLNSGMGRLERVDLADGSREVVALLPGYARGLAIYRGLAFVGLSRIRETAVFGDVPIAEFHDRLKCGVGIVEVATGKTLATLEFATGVEEIFDVQVVPGARCLTFGSSETGDDAWLVPAVPV
ncbi:TIGR03032 family protein [Nocardioides pelophilus]|uniref:TIGR03032 family protein n=1 Tax=Nocardioides pelophilus TaxID=2172019 RepID=UPI0016014E23|nr:TIGR03032 family protein [Nocardioides pelophilus]